MAPSDARFVRPIFERPGIVRGELADLLGISPAGAAVSIRRLVRQGVLIQAGPAPSQGGRPAARLLAAPDLAVAFAHSLSADGMRSALINMAGEILESVEIPLEDAHRISKAIERAETGFKGTIRGRQLAGSAVALPGVPHPDTRAIAKAPWLFGPNERILGGGKRTRLSCNAVSNAEALLRVETAADPSLRSELVLAVDLNDGATAVLLTPEGSRIHLNLFACNVPKALLTREGIGEWVRDGAAHPDSTLSLRIGEGLGEIEALKRAEDDGDVGAARIIDKLTERISDLLVHLARMMRPANLVVSSWLVASELCSPDEVRRCVRRRCPAGVADRLSFRFAENHEWTHAVGAALCAIDLWLEEHG